MKANGLYTTAWPTLIFSRVSRKQPLVLFAQRVFGCFRRLSLVGDIMKKWISLAVVLLAVVEGVSAKPLAKSTPQLPVFPRAVSTLAPISLGEMVFRAIPTRKGMGWDHLQIAQVRWLTEGFDFTETGFSTRLGLSRVRANGVVTRMLRQRWEELTWSVELETEGNVKWGPTSLLIRPGYNTQESKGQYICFGTGFEGCDFPISALNNPKLKLTKQCEVGSSGGSSIVMLGTTTDGRQGTVVYSGSGGSGGYSNSVEISMLTPAEYCSVNKDRGY